MGAGSFKSLMKDVREDLESDREVKYEFVSSGILMFDWAVGKGGIPRGCLFNLFGNESLGKTTLALSILGERTKYKEQCVFIDVEHRVNPDLVKILVPEPDYLEIVRPKDGDAALTMLDKFSNHSDVRVIVIDSLPAIVPVEMTEEDFNPNRTGISASRITLAIKKLMKPMFDNGTIVIALDQMRDNMNFLSKATKKETSINAVKFHSSIRMHMKPDEPVKDGSVVIGHRVKVKLVKNSWAFPGKIAPITIMYGKGIDKVKDLIECGIATGVIEKAVGWYTYEDTDENGEKVAYKAHGEAELLEKLTPIMPRVQERLRTAMVDLTSVGAEDKAEEKVRDETEE